MYLSEMPVAKKLWEGAGGAVVTGLVCGALATVSSWAYYVALVLTILGGLPAGTQHRTLRGAALRGAAAGALWSVALLAAIAISPDEALDVIPRPLVTIAVIAVVFTSLVSTAVWTFWRRTNDRRHRSTVS